jgi:hypothetical protein
MRRCSSRILIIGNTFGHSSNATLLYPIHLMIMHPIPIVTISKATTTVIKAPNAIRNPCKTCTKVLKKVTKRGVYPKRLSIPHILMILLRTQHCHKELICEATWFPFFLTSGAVVRIIHILRLWSNSLAIWSIWLWWFYRRCEILSLWTRGQSSNGR